MSTFRNALTTLSQLSVSGVAHNYDIDAVPDNPARAQLPALLVLPIDIQEDRLALEKGRGFQSVAFSSGKRTITYTVTHLLLVAPIGQGKGLRAHLPTLVNFIDAYFVALGANVTLGGTLLEPTAVRVEPGVFPVGSTEYYGCAFRHTWVMEL